MNSISKEYRVDQAAARSARSDPAVCVRGPILEEVYLSLIGPASKKDLR